jgi:hypothetical protein
MPTEAARPLEELSAAGLLWLFNRELLHPRGVALALAFDEDGHVVGWTMQGDGVEPMTFDPETDEEKSAMVEALFTSERTASAPAFDDKTPSRAARIAPRRCKRCAGCDPARAGDNDDRDGRPHIAHKRNVSAAAPKRRRPGSFGRRSTQRWRSIVRSHRPLRVRSYASTSTSVPVTRTP